MVHPTFSRNDLTLRVPNWVDRLADLMVAAGIVVLMVHPTVSSLFGPSGSRISGLTALLLLSPSVRNIRFAPVLGLFLSAGVLAFLSRDSTPLFAAAAGYSIFDLLLRRPRFAVNVFFGLLAVATAAGLLQVWLPPESIVNFHATAQSEGGWLNRVRPTSIFPSQVYLTQLQLICVALMALVRERRLLIFILVGFSCAVSGSTGGLVAALLAFCLLWRRGVRPGVVYRAAGLLVAYGGVMLAFSIFSPARFAATSPIDFGASVFSTRILLDDAAGAIETIAVSSAGAPNMGLIIVKLVSIAGAILGSFLLVQALQRHRFAELYRVTIVFVSVAIAQAVLPVIESMFFAFSFAALMHGFAIFFGLAVTPGASGKTALEGRHGTRR